MESRHVCITSPTTALFAVQDAEQVKAFASTKAETVHWSHHRKNPRKPWKSIAASFVIWGRHARVVKELGRVGNGSALQAAYFLEVHYIVDGVILGASFRLH